MCESPSQLGEPVPLPGQRPRVAATHEVHPDGGGRGRLDLSADILNEGVLVLIVDDNLGSRGGHQEGVVVGFFYVQDHLQSWAEKREQPEALQVERAGPKGPGWERLGLLFPQHVQLLANKEIPTNLQDIQSN